MYAVKKKKMGFFSYDSAIFVLPTGMVEQSHL